jgi:hypothetical protein
VYLALRNVWQYPVDQRARRQRPGRGERRRDGDRDGPGDRAWWAARARYTEQAISVSSVHGQGAGGSD